MTKAKPHGPYVEPLRGSQKKWSAEGPHPKRELLRARGKLITRAGMQGGKQKRGLKSRKKEEVGEHSDKVCKI